jgi:hypothetical protein
LGSCAACCLECFTDFYDKTAFSYCAVSGDPFCTGCTSGFYLYLKHGIEYSWAMTLAGGFIWLGKIAIVAVNTFLSLMVMKYYTDDLQNDAGNVFTPLCFIAFTTFLTANMFLSQFDEAVCTMLTCMSIDKDLNGGMAKFGPPTFHDAVTKVTDEKVAQRA